MPEPLVIFEEFNGLTRTTYRFFPDRIEVDWKIILRNGREVYSTANITGHLAEQTTFAYGLSRTLRSLALYLVGGLVLHLGFEQALLNRIGFVLYGFAALAAILALLKMKKDTWLYVKLLDGATLFCIREKGLKGISREEFVRAIQAYAKKTDR